MAWTAAQIEQRLRRVPAGFVTTYGDLSPGAPRLAGWVLAGTTAKLPWWRVVRSDGTLTQGERQRQLLDGEAVPFRGQRVDLRQARINPDALD